MPIVNRVADLQPDIQAWRRDIHQHPELLYDVHRTAAFVAERLREFGCDEVATGLGRTGVVGVIRGRKPAGKGDVRMIGLRADMDALPIEEATGSALCFQDAGKMHACGHDGHTAMLLGAARYLAETRNFAGDAVVIFQPAEEGGAGAAAMIKDGLMERFAIDQVYGMHNGPGIPVGSFAIRPGPIMAATDADRHPDRRAVADMRRGRTNASIPCMVGAQLITALQSIVVAQRRSAGICRHLDLRVPCRQCPQRHSANRRTEGHRSHADAGSAGAGREARARGRGRRRADHRRQDRPGIRARLSGGGQSRRADRCRDRRGKGNRRRRQCCRDAADDGRGGFRLSCWRQRPGAFIFCGNGDSAGLHHPAYNFNDEAIVFGTSYWIKLVENTLAA